MKKKIIILVSILLVLGGGAAAYFFFFAKKDVKKEVKEEKVEITAELMEKASLDIEEISTNLLEDHYVIVQVNIVFKDEKLKTEGEHRAPQFKSEIIRTLNGMSKEELSGSENFDKFEESLKTKFNHIMGEKEETVLGVSVTSLKTQ